MKYQPKIVKAYYMSEGLPEPEFEYKIINDRKYAWDICFPKFMVWVEVQGGVWKGLGHNTGKGLTRDYEKHNLATLAGWKGIYVLPSEVCMLETVHQLKRLLYE